MPLSLLPKYLLTALALALAIICIVSLALYSNYTQLSRELVRSGVEQRDFILKSRLEGNGVTFIQSIERELDAYVARNDTTTVAALIADALEEHDEIETLEIRDAGYGLIYQFGQPNNMAAAEHTGERLLWANDHLIISSPIVYQGKDFGYVTGYLDPAPMRTELADFREELLQLERTYSVRGAIWVAAATFGMLLGCAFLAWLTASRLVKPITEITEHANNISAGDYGESLPVDRRDELGDLALAFNRMKDQLRQTTISRDYMDSVLSSMNDAVIVTGPDGTITKINSATTAMLEYSEEELLGLPLETVVTEKQRDKFSKAPLGGRPRETVFETRQGEMIPVSWTGSIIETNNPLFQGHIYTAQNIRERKRAEQRIRYLARIDALTKVPNRMQFQHLLQRGIARARRERHCLALLYVDVDQFKDINDTFGHLAGDAALETLTQRLIRELPDKSVVGRLAGDEFAVILDDLPYHDSTRANVDTVASTALKRLAEPFDVQGHEVFMTASIGIAFYPDDAQNVIDLIRNADAALYHAKKSGGNSFDFYAAEMNEAAVERLMLKSKLRRSFEREELLLHYQPKYSLVDGRVIGAEALVRWELPDRGIVMPADFIPLAEETNLIIEIGDWVIDKVCKDLREWQNVVADPGRVAINLSLKQLRQPNFTQRIVETFKRHEISPTSLEFEITETTLMEDSKKTIKLLDELYALGLHLAIDDFGTGYSSLSALQQFPIHTLKIDQSFVRDAAIDADDATIVETIIDMGRSLKMDVVAEGVETEEQLGFLQTLNCNYVQGLLFGDPMTATDYLQLLIAQEGGSNTHRALFG